MNLDFLECGVCLDIFKPPIFMLSCGHDFCYDCLLGAFSNNNACPECRAVQSVEHIDQLNRNRRLEKAVLSLKTTKSGLDLDGFIREIGMRQKSFDLRQKFV